MRAGNTVMRFSSALYFLHTAAGDEQRVIGPAQPAHDVDVVVVGAGLSGLAAARYLIDANKSIHVLEARNRVGGKVLNEALDNGGITEVGAAFVGPTQDHVLALAKELQLNMFLEYDNGSRITTISQASQHQDLQAILQQQLGILDDMAASVDVWSPWAHPNASLWDSITFAQWLDSSTESSDVKALISTASTLLWGANPHEMSFLYVLAYMAAAGNETTAGSMSRLLATDGGAQMYRVEGGTGLLPQGLASKIGQGKISLNSPVRSITLQDSSQYLVRSDSIAVTARNVVVAMSPPLAARIVYEPPLPAHRDQISQRMFMGSAGKATAIFDSPFWRAANLSGQSLNPGRFVGGTFDVSPPNGEYGALLGFIMADSMRELDDMTVEEIETRAGNELIEHFGPDASRVRQWVIKRWDNDIYSRGGPAAVAGPGALTSYGAAIREPWGRIHFAGTESSEYWTGYMDGAIRSGERAAREALETFGAPYGATVQLIRP